jgi:hypothetical protein
LAHRAKPSVVIGLTIYEFLFFTISPLAANNAPNIYLQKQGLLLLRADTLKLFYKTIKQVNRLELVLRFLYRKSLKWDYIMQLTDY